MIKLAEAVAVSAVDDDGVGARDVEAVFDDGGGTEDIVFAIHESKHSSFELGFRHLSMADDDACVWYELANFRG